MNRIIINNKTELDDARALHLVSHVIKMGRISKNDKQYCYATLFNLDEGEFGVITRLNKKSDSFTIINHKEVNE